MYYQLSPKQEQYLLSLPETGMCYQVIEAKRNGTELMERFVVLNCELAIELNDAAPLCVKQVAMEGIETIKRKALSFPWEITHVYNHDKEVKPTSTVAESRSEFPDGGEIFVRRSIYENDKRIDHEKKSLRPGSFTTTLNDSVKYRNNSDDPLIQLAMDHGVRGKWGYYFQPKRSNVLQRGKPDPKTGAKEVYFRDGTSFGTFLQCKVY